MKLFTIGFTRKSAETFFMLLKNAGVKRLIDVRLNNVSQLAGFTKKDDLRYFTKAICNIEYVHLPELAPTADILDPYKKAKNGDWESYERQFLELIRARHVEDTISRELLDGGCLLFCYVVKKSHTIATGVSSLNISKRGGVMLMLILNISASLPRGGPVAAPSQRFTPSLPTC
ncbi:MAG: DUF488 family protein [Terriglobales bacterium]